MRTPEEIAERLMAEVSLKDYQSSRGSEVRGLLIEAAHEAQAEPSFKPEGEVDDYRDSAEYLAETTDGPIRLEFWMRWSGKVSHDITKDQAERILKMLSSEAEQ